jgi:hypothetical protein
LIFIVVVNASADSEQVVGKEDESKMVIIILSKIPMNIK